MNPQQLGSGDGDLYRLGVSSSGLWGLDTASLYHFAKHPNFSQHEDDVELCLEMMVTLWKCLVMALTGMGADEGSGMV
jgi:hypothetical protein